MKQVSLAKKCKDSLPDVPLSEKGRPKIKKSSSKATAGNSAQQFVPGRPPASTTAGTFFRAEGRSVKHGGPAEEGGKPAGSQPILPWPSWIICPAAEASFSRLEDLLLGNRLSAGHYPGQVQDRGC